MCIVVSHLVCIVVVVLCVLLLVVLFVLLLVVLCVLLLLILCVLLLFVFCLLLSSYVYLLYYVCIPVFTLDAGLLAISQYSEGPATGHLDTGFSWFPCVYKQMCGGIVLEEALDLSFDRLLMMMMMPYKRYIYIYIYIYVYILYAMCKSNP
jgi:hypothetical protein